MKIAPFSIIFLIVLILLSTDITAQNREVSHLKDSLPLDPKITYGTLDNGFTYYIYKHENPGNHKVFMKFIVNTGFFDEDAHQVQVAHAIEHVAFIPNKNFPEGIKFGKLSDIGVLSSDIGGGTFGDHTIYDFNFPADKPEALETGLLWFRDIAGNLTFPKKNIHQVAKEIQGEYMLNEKVDLVRMQYLPGLYPALKGDGSDPVSYMKHYTPKTFQSFYGDWYRPNRMAVLIVGNAGMNEDKIIARIKSRFSDLDNPDELRKRRDYDQVYLNKQDQLISVVERELTENRILLYFRHSRIHLKSGNDFKTLVLRKILDKMLAKRVKSVNKQYLAPTTLAHVKRETYPPALLIELRTNSADSIKPAIQASMKELKRIQQHGFEKYEMEVAKQELSREYLSKGNVDAKTLLGEIEQHFVTREALPEMKNDMIKKLLSSITLNEIECMFSQTIGKKAPMDIVLMTPKKHKEINEATVFRWIKQAWKKSMTPYSGIVPPTRLLKPGIIAEIKEKDYQIRENKEYRITELILGNGTRVVLKPTDQQSDNIKVHGFSFGGASRYSAEDYYSALNSAKIIHHSGVGGMDLFELERYVSHKKMKIMPYVTHREEGIEGDCDKEDIESLMQLVYLYFTQPNKNEKAFQDWLMEREAILLKANNSDTVLRDSIANVLGDSSHVNVQSEIQRLSKTRLQSAYAIYKERFANAGDFTFVIVGDFEIDKMIPVVNKYLGLLPDHNIREFIHDKSKTLPQGPRSYDIRTSINGSKVDLCFAGEAPCDIYEEVRLQVLQHILISVLNKRLRYQEAGVYHTMAFYKQYRFPDWYKLNIVFKCNKEDIERLVRATWDEIDRLKENGPQNADMENAVNWVKSSFDKPKQNHVILEELSDHYRGKKTLQELNQQRQYLGRLTQEDIKNIAIKYLKQNSLFRFVVLPENNQL